MSMPNQPSENEQCQLTERFVRWQGNLRQNLSSHVTLIVSWSAGGLAFCGVLLNSDQANFGKITTGLFLVTGALFILCLIMSLFISWNRLKDTRATLEIVKARMDGESQDSIKELQRVTKKLEDRTWCAIGFQLWCFILAAFFLVATVLLAFKGRFDTF